ncbi:hypothetical protein B7463_g9084, partial [Scytalidium lignicola]
MMYERPLQDPNWQPILHRDLKPDNILLRSRATEGSQKPPYCVISDFGLACYEKGNDKFQSSWTKLGTKPFWAPELCLDPIGDTGKYFSSPHSRWSDVWALGVCIYGLCRSNSLAHFIQRGDRYERNPILDPGRAYSQPLRDNVMKATEWSGSKREDARLLVKQFHWDVKHDKTVKVDIVLLPDWAMKKRSY